MKKLVAILLFSFSLSAQAVDVTITLTVGQAQRFAAVCGQIRQLVDTQEPPQPRACTVAEAKELVIALMRRLVVDVEGAAAEKAAREAVVVPAFDPQ